MLSFVATGVDVAGVAVVAGVVTAGVPLAGVVEVATGLDGLAAFGVVGVETLGAFVPVEPLVLFFTVLSAV